VGDGQDGVATSEAANECGPLVQSLCDAIEAATAGAGEYMTASLPRDIATAEAIPSRRAEAQAVAALDGGPVVSCGSSDRAADQAATGTCTAVRETGGGASTMVTGSVGVAYAMHLCAVVGGGAETRRGCCLTTITGVELLLRTYSDIAGAWHVAGTLQLAALPGHTWADTREAPCVGAEAR